MAIHTYTTYGAYEMKASYQRNMFYGNLAVVSFVSMILLSSWLFSSTKPPVICDLRIEGNTVRVDDPTIPIDADRIIIRGSKPKLQIHSGVIPTMISDDDFIDDDPIELIVKDDPAIFGTDDGLPFDPDNSNTGSFDLGGVGDETYPGENQFVPHEKEPEMYFYSTPSYPRLCRMAEIEGDVIMKVLVGKDGKVKKAMVAKSSGSEALDDAALQVAYDNLFTPALQNSIPVSLWVVYTVTFRLR